jgi:hypothetical protein
VSGKSITRWRTLRAKDHFIIECKIVLEVYPTFLVIHPTVFPYNKRNTYLMDTISPELDSTSTIAQANHVARTVTDSTATVNSRNPYINNSSQRRIGSMNAAVMSSYNDYFSTWSRMNNSDAPASQPETPSNSSPRRAYHPIVSTSRPDPGAFLSLPGAPVHYAPNSSIAYTARTSAPAHTQSSASLGGRHRYDHGSLQGIYPSENPYQSGRLTARHANISATRKMNEQARQNRQAMVHAGSMALAPVPRGKRASS